METNFVVRFFENVAKFFYALLPTVLPYSTPLPIAMITASSAEHFFGMTPMIAGVFVFSLEGLGVWSTTTFIDKFVDWVRSRNPKVAWMSFIMGVVVAAYLTILVLLNVVLKGDNTTAYKWAVTLVCFLPFIAGILNGFRKVDLTDQDAALAAQALQEKRRQDELARQKELEVLKSDERVKKAALKQGFNILAEPAAQPQLPAPAEPKTKEKTAADYHAFVLELLDQHNGALTPRQITDMVNKTKRISLEHEKVKSSWTRYTQEWRSKAK
jgi:hypothetical protein